MRAMAGLQLMSRPFEGGLVDPFNRVFEDAAILLLGLAERLFRGLPGGDVPSNAKDAYRRSAESLVPHDLIHLPG